ncbi:hypothetical protein K435DRAFT_672696 [Dendrothele bispora CBS 962.96]|uniref:Glyoxalase-like domain-containing protein n=1 Tax=Dendrothele bispora (strain CBS 962.96) TaxID=1314807 RepID=A0A4S8LRQ2_DENBC|nr:hypothetical protein K435DRAFT_672696 [Dendrothele bispora CBS 962.96]
MALPSTKCLDHIVHLTPPGSVQETTTQFENLGFRVLPGGQHADGLTENALVVLQDDVYLELISFVHYPENYPPGTPEREKRDNHKWAKMAPGWIDFAFLGNGSETTRISDIINNRTRADGREPFYKSEVSGGRLRPDGVELKWLITDPEPLDSKGVLPFFCGDVTPRELRVPSKPPTNAEHPSSALGIAFVRVRCTPNVLDDLSRKFSDVIGSSPHISGKTHEWELETLHQYTITPGGRKCHLILEPHHDEAIDMSDTATAIGIYELGIFVQKEQPNPTVKTPYGKLVWVKA